MSNIFLEIDVVDKIFNIEMSLLHSLSCVDLIDVLDNLLSNLILSHL